MEKEGIESCDLDIFPWKMTLYNLYWKVNDSDVYLFFFFICIFNETGYRIRNNQLSFG